MQNNRLKSLLESQIKLANQQTSDVSLLNQEELDYALGGSAAEGCSCPMLTSCDKYCNCGAKVKIEL